MDIRKIAAVAVAIGAGASIFAACSNSKKPITSSVPIIEETTAKSTAEATTT